MSAKALATRFEDGLHIDVVEKMKAGDPTTMRQVYVDAGHAERVLNKRKAVSGEKRQAESSEGSNRPRKKGNFNRDQSRPNDNSRQNSGRRDGPRVYYCKRCTFNHPGKDCDGNLVEYRHCGKEGHVVCYGSTKC